MKGKIEFEENRLIISHEKRKILFMRINEDYLQIQIHEGDHKDPKKETVHSFAIGKSGSLCVKEFFRKDSLGKIV